MNPNDFYPRSNMNSKHQ